MTGPFLCLFWFFGRGCGFRRDSGFGLIDALHWRLRVWLLLFAARLAERRRAREEQQT